jgi:hypothetical protein
MVTRSHPAFYGFGQPIALPRPARSAAPLAALAVVALILVLAPDVPRGPAAVAALAFALAAVARAAHEQRTLRRLRATADALLVLEPSAPCSPLLSWRCSELTSQDAREHLAASIGRVERAAAPSVLPGAAPLNRGAVRANRIELDAIADRLLLPEPVAARGVILVRRLLTDPAGPLFGVDRSRDLAGEIRQALHALDGRSVTGSR